MLESPWSRAAVVVLLLAGLVGLGAWYGSLAPAPDAGDYPGAESLAADYERHVGERVEVAGWAVETDPLVVAVSDLRLVVSGLDRPVEVGDMVWVYGIAQAAGSHEAAAGVDGHVRATDAVVISPAAFRYGRGVSLLAGLWVLGRILRDWRLDRRTWGLAPDPAGSWPIPLGTTSGTDHSDDAGAAAEEGSGDA